MIEISKLTKTYDRGTKALKDVNITIDDGEPAGAVPENLH